MSAIAILLELRARGVTFTPRGEALTYRGPAEALDPDTLDRLRAVKPILLAVLQAENEGSHIPMRPCSPNRTGEHQHYWFSTSRCWTCWTCHPPVDPGLVLTEWVIPKPPLPDHACSEPHRDGAPFIPKEVQRISIDTKGIPPYTPRR